METSRPPTDASHSASTASETGCCPRFDPTVWQDQELCWEDKPFLKEHVRAFFHVPVGLASLFAREQALIASAQARTEPEIVLSDETSLFGADYYFAVAKEVPGADVAHLSGTYLTRVFEGPYRKVGDWVEQMEAHIAERGKELEHLYFWYTTCPKCAKAYGKNYVVLFAKLR